MIKIAYPRELWHLHMVELFGRKQTLIFVVACLNDNSTFDKCNIEIFLRKEKIFSANFSVNIIRLFIRISHLI